MKKTDFLNQFQVSEKDLEQLCQRAGVKTLYIFGSILSPEFSPGKSDLDFLVEFDSPSFDGFFDFHENLKDLFNYENIDLVTIGSLKNKIIRETIISSRETLYAA